MLPHAQSQVKSSLGFQFVAMPTDILRRDDLSAPAKLLAAVIIDSARNSPSGRCKLTNASMGAKIGRSAVSVKRLLGELEAAGVVRRETIADKHNRAAILPTWADQIRPTEQASADQDRPAPGSDSTPTPAQDRPAIQSPGSELGIQTGPNLPLDSGEKRPSPEQVAAAMRAMIAGTYSDAMFSAGAKGVANPDSLAAKDTHQASTHPIRRPDASPAKGTPEKGTHEPRTLPDLRTMFGRVGYSARAAAFRRETPRKTAAEQIAELRRRSAERERQGVSSM
jgi:hypothetical protein